jgi:hypothetical protein
MKTCSHGRRASRESTRPSGGDTFLRGPPANATRFFEGRLLTLSRRSGAWWTWHSERACTPSCESMPLTRPTRWQTNWALVIPGMACCPPESNEVGAPHFIAARATRCGDTTLDLLSALDPLELPRPLAPPRRIPSAAHGSPAAHQRVGL